MSSMKMQTQLIQETGHFLNRIDQLVSSSTSQAIALEILTSPDIMRALFQTRLSNIYPEGLNLRECRPEVLRKRLGSRQVIAYTLILLNEGGRKTSPVELVGKRYADGAEGERAFRTMQMLWEGGFGEGSRLKIPSRSVISPILSSLSRKRPKGAYYPVT